LSAAAQEAGVPNALARTRDADEARERILGATFRVVAEHTINGTRMPAVAAEAGLSQGLIFYHFDSKDNLLLSLLDWLLERFRSFEGVVGGKVVDLPPKAEVAALRQAFLAYARYLAVGEPEMSRVFYDFWVQAVAHDGHLREKLKEQFRLYRLDVKGLLTDATVGPARADVIAGLIVSLFEGMVLQLALDPKAFDIDSYLSTADLLLQELSARSA
jgi:AcrR family transcriptional regulator